MTYEELTAEQKADLATADTYYRRLLRNLQQVFKDADASVNAPWLAVNADPIVASLGDGELIPNSTGLAGAKPLTVAEFRLIQQAVREVWGIRLRAELQVPIAKALGVNAE